MMEIVSAIEHAKLIIDSKLSCSVKEISDRIMTKIE